MHKLRHGAARTKDDDSKNKDNDNNNDDDNDDDDNNDEDDRNYRNLITRALSFSAMGKNTGIIQGQVA